MIKVLIIDPSKHFADLLVVDLKKLIPQVRLVWRPSYTEGLVVLQQHPDADALIAPFVDDQGESIFDHLLDLRAGNKDRRYFLYSPGGQVSQKINDQCREYEQFGVYPHCLSKSVPALSTTVVSVLF